MTSSLTDTIAQSLDKIIQTGVVYLDFAKGFDSADHLIILQKLKRYDVEGHMHAWFADYLPQWKIPEGRIGWYSSQWTLVSSGVPQGSLRR